VHVAEVGGIGYAYIIFIGNMLENNILKKGEGYGSMLFVLRMFVVKDHI